MTQLNNNYFKLQTGYLFPEISRRVSQFLKENPNQRILRMGIGDVTRPLSSSVIAAFADGVKEMGVTDTFRGYGPEQGYNFLREAISKDYQSRGANISPNEIFISDGSKCDTGNILEIFDMQSVIGVCDPVYPVYVDAAVMAGRTGNVQKNGYFERLTYLQCVEENNFLPAIPKQRLDLIFLCFPNNPTGQVATKEYLLQWVQYAKQN
ncbi:MAG: aminotransferase class I/II-fold pyridoxal phosphate-dependent enzyme, partial [Leptonema sp. (in: Bacteria)]|nr:aminotransferase class I/II-fold pyridoxal phosphate-dependent enzyme [Leptonema sp. (in: bacteria)]